MHDFQWIWGLIIGAVYLYSAYKGNEKKKGQEEKKQKDYFPPNPTPTAKPTSIPRSVFTDLFGDEAPAAPKPTPQPRRQNKPVVKNAPKPKPVFVHREVEPNENTNTTADIHISSLKEANEAYAIGVEGDTYSFNLRDAVIANIILTRPEY